MQRHKYDYEPKPHSAGEKVMRMVGEGRRVLELGPGPGAITRLLYARRCRVTAVELDRSALEIVAPYCERVVVGDLNQPDWPKVIEGAGDFETVVAADVLEHLYDPWTTLRGLKPLLADGGCLVISLPHVGHCALLGDLMAGNFDYGPWGLLDRTHIRFFGIRNIQQLFEDAGFKIVEADFVVKEPADTEFARQWRQLSSDTKEILRKGPFASIYQVIVKAVPKEAPGVELQLATSQVPAAPRESWEAKAVVKRLTAYLLSFLSLETRQKIGEFVKRITKSHRH